MIKRSKNGFTIIEICVTAAVGAVALAGLFALNSGAHKGAARNEGSAEAMRAALVVSELLRADLERMVYQRASDITISDDGQRLSLQCPLPLTDDLLRFRAVPVYYELKPTGTRGVFALARSEQGVEKPVAGCLLADVQFRRVAGTKRGRNRGGFLEVIVVGTSAAGRGDAFTTSFLFPLKPERPTDA